MNLFSPSNSTPIKLFFDQLVVQKCQKLILWIRSWKERLHIHKILIKTTMMGLWLVLGCEVRVTNYDSTAYFICRIFLLSHCWLYNATQKNQLKLFYVQQKRTNASVYSIDETEILWNFRVSSGSSTSSSVWTDSPGNDPNNSISIVDFYNKRAARVS